MSGTSLRRGTTGFRNANEPPLALVDLVGFRRDLHFVCRQVGARVLRSSEELQADRNFFDATIELEDRELSVLLNCHHPYVALAPAPSLPLTFADHGGIQRGFAELGNYVVMTRADLEAPVTSEATADLGTPELSQFAYWKPESIGEIVFNHWD